MLPAWLYAVVFSAGHFGVPIFFVLSGFVIAYSIGAARVGLGYIGRFALRRSIRLDPPYWFAIAFALAILAVKSHAVSDGGAKSVTVGQVIAHIFYLQNFLGYDAINPVYWTLTFEIQFYLFFCLLLGVAHTLRKSETDRRPQMVIFAVAAVVSIVWPCWCEAFHPPALALRHWHGFLLGVFACWVFGGVMYRRWFYIYAAVLLVCHWLSGSDLKNAEFPIACTAAAIMIIEVARAGLLTRWLRWRWVQFLGMISYSLYLLHNPLSGAAFNVLYRYTSHTVAQESLTLVLVVIINCGVAYACWWLIERPSTALARRLKLPK